LTAFNSITFTYKVIKLNENSQIITVHVSTSLSFLQPHCVKKERMNVLYKKNIWTCVLFIQCGWRKLSEVETCTV